MPTNNPHFDVGGRLLGFFVFLIGIGLLCAVFGVAWSLFHSAVPGLQLPIREGAPPPAAIGIGVALSAFVRQLLLLAVMTIAGSIVAGKGALLYLTAGHHYQSPTSAEAAVAERPRLSM